MNMTAPRYGSDHIDSIGYNDDAATLVIKFHRGGAYSYEGVDPSMYTRLLTASSPGSFFRSQIKGRYRHRRLRG